jgi:DNA-directed RNA polymerase specialized sigma24 family protein
MNDHLLVEALRERDPAAPAAVYDAYADRLYAYCWFQLHDRDAAQVALRDTFIVAEAHIGRLRETDRFGPWLYAIARLECGRLMVGHDHSPDLPVPGHDQEDVDQRIMAWHAVRSLEPLSREILELRVRHQLSVPDLAAVFDLPIKDAQAELERAHTALEAALTAEILAHERPYGCQERGVLLRERRGGLTGDLSARLLRHAEECGVCQAFRSRTVSAAKVYGLLPQAEPPESLRARVMSCFFDPELVGYRLFVATRTDEFNPAGFPVRPWRSVLPRQVARARGLPRRRVFRRAPNGAPLPAEGGRGRAAAHAVAALAVVALLLGGGAAAFRWLTGPDGRDSGTAVSGGVRRYPAPVGAARVHATSHHGDAPPQPRRGDRDSSRAGHLPAGSARLVRVIATSSGSCEWRKGLIGATRPAG